MRVLIIHNQLWAHYKSKLFGEINSCLQIEHPDAEFKVVQIALYESSRASMQASRAVAYDYPYEVLFQKSLDEVGLKERIKALFSAYKAYQPTVLNITGYFDWAQILLMFYARLNGVKVVMSTESGASDQKRSGVKEQFKKWIINTSNAYFCFGTSSVNYFTQLGVDPQKFKVTHAAVVDDELIQKVYSKAHAERKNSDSRRVIYVGRLAPEKNLPLLLQAFKSVTIDAKLSNWELLIVGDGPDSEALKKRAAELLGDQCKFTGGIPWFEVPNYFAKADVFVLPSKSEPWGLVVNEAMICGLPVVVSNKCGCIDDLILEDQTGYTFDPVSQIELEENLQKLMLLSDEERAALGENCKQVVQKFSASKVASEMVDTFEELNKK